MTMKLSFFIFLLFSAFSTENYMVDVEEILVQLQEPDKSSQGLQKQEQAADRFKMTPKLLQLIKPYSESPNLMKMQMNEKQVWSKKIYGILNVFPNESTVKILRDMETNKISWEDPNELVPQEFKEEIEFCLQQEGKEKSNGLFDCVSDWYKADDSYPFVKELFDCISQHVDVDRRGKTDLSTPLMFAVFYETEKAVAKLIERGADLEAIDEDGETALHWAAGCGAQNMVEILVENGAKIDAQNQFLGNTPLIMAAKDGHVEAVKTLLKLGADAKITNINDETALDYAMQYELQDFAHKKEICAEIILTHMEEN